MTVRSIPYSGKKKYLLFFSQFTIIIIIIILFKSGTLWVRLTVLREVGNRQADRQTNAE